MSWKTLTDLEIFERHGISKEEYLLISYKERVLLNRRYTSKRKDAKETYRLYRLNNLEKVKVWQKNRKPNKEALLIRKLKINKILNDIKLTTGCQRCGYKEFSCCLAFHHLIPKDKKMRLSNSHTRSLKSIYEEIEKCIVLCVNCHALEHSSPRKNIKNIQEKKDKCDNLKLELGCCICGFNSNSCFLEFHHINPKDKLNAVSILCKHNINRLIAEINKCCIVCIMCHKKYHNKIIDIDLSKFKINIKNL